MKRTPPVSESYASPERAEVFSARPLDASLAGNYHVTTTTTFLFLDPSARSSRNARNHTFRKFPLQSLERRLVRGCEKFLPALA